MTPTKEDYEKAKEFRYSHRHCVGYEYEFALAKLLAETREQAFQEGYDKCKQEWKDSNYNDMVERNLRD